MEKLLLPSALNFNIPDIDIMFMEEISTNTDETTWKVLPFEGFIFYSMLTGNTLTSIDQLWCEYMDTLYSLYKVNPTNFKLKSHDFERSKLDTCFVQQAGISYLLAKSYTSPQLNRALNLFTSIVTKEIHNDDREFRNFVENIERHEDVDSLRANYKQQSELFLQELEELQLKYEALYEISSKSSIELETSKNQQVELEKKVKWLRSKNTESEKAAARQDENFQKELKNFNESIKDLKLENDEALNALSRANKNVEHLRRKVQALESQLKSNDGSIVRLESANGDLVKKIKALSIQLDREHKNNESLKRQIALKELLLVDARNALRAFEKNKAVKVSKSLKAILSKVLNNADSELKENVRLLEGTALFNKEWYSQYYSDVQDTNLSPEEHYLTVGFLEGKQPSENFDGLSYLKAYPDVAERGVNPLVHYLRFGRSEGRIYQSNLLELSDGKNNG